MARGDGGLGGIKTRGVAGEGRVGSRIGECGPGGQIKYGITKIKIFRIRYKNKDNDKMKDVM